MTYGAIDEIEVETFIEQSIDQDERMDDSIRAKEVYNEYITKMEQKKDEVKNTESSYDFNAQAESSNNLSQSKEKENSQVRKEQPPPTKTTTTKKNIKVMI